MYTLGALLLFALLLTAVIAVIDSVLHTIKLDKVIHGLPIIGAHWGLVVGCLMVWVLDISPAAGWGLEFTDRWMTIVANGFIIYGMIPVKDATISMVNRGLRLAA